MELGGGGAAAPILFSNSHFGGVVKTSNIRAKPLDFQANNGENIRARDFSPLPKTKLVPHAYGRGYKLGYPPPPTHTHTHTHTIDNPLRLLRIIL